MQEVTGKDAWREVTRLRKAADLDAAELLGRQANRDNPSDKFLRDALAWVYYERIRTLARTIAAAAEKRGPFDSRACLATETLLRDYARLKPTIPDLCHSMILRQLNHVGRQLQCYLGFLKWSGPACFRDPEDFNAGEKDGKPLPSLAANVAREAIAWILEQPEKRRDQADWVLRFASDIYERDPEVWIDLDRARLCKSIGDLTDASKYVRRVLVKKRNEAWAWGEVADVLRLSNQHRLAVSAYCRACLLGRGDEFLIRIRVALAGLLAQESEYRWAATELLAVRDLYDQKGWHHSRDLARALDSDWFQREAGQGISRSDAQGAYKSRADAALELLFENVTELDGVFIGKDQLGRLRFAVVQGTAHRAVFGNKDAAIALEPGAPVTARVASQAGGLQLLSYDLRENGKAWDCIPPTAIGAFGSAAAAQDVAPTAICRVRGSLVVKPGGFGFVGDVFVGESLVDGTLKTGDSIDVVAGRRLDKSKNRWGWSALAVVDPA